MTASIIAPTLARGREVAREMGIRGARVFSANSPRTFEGFRWNEGDRLIIVGIAKGASGKSFPITDTLRRNLAKSRHVVEPEYVP